MINISTKLNHFKSLIESRDYIPAVQAGLDFFCHVGSEYERLEIYNDQSYDGDDFGTREVERLLAEVIRNDATSIETVRSVENEMAKIRKMAAYDDYYLASFSKVDEAISYRIADADTYLAELDRRIERYGRNYRRMVNGREDAGMDLVLYMFNDLEDSLLKKIGYLRRLEKQEDATTVIHEYRHVPAIRSLIINEYMANGDDDGALAAIDEGIGIYGDDGYSSTAKWHKQKIALLEKRGDKKGVIEEYRRLFRQFLSDKKMYFEKLKELVPPKEWKEFAMSLFCDIPHIDDEDCILVCDLIVHEQLYRCLLRILMANEGSFHRSEIFAKYVKYLNEEEQTGFINMIIDKLRDRLSYAKSKSYGYITDEMRVLHDSCPVGGKLVSEFVKEVILRYGNRPALIRLLGIDES